MAAGSASGAAAPSGHSRALMEQRMDKIEELICSGIAPGRIERMYGRSVSEGGWGLSARQIRNIIAKVYERWELQSIADAPHRREKVVRMAERLYAKCMSGEKPNLPAALGALGLLARMSGAFVQHDPERAERLRSLGPPPEDPTQALVYAQRAMLLSLSEVVNHPTLDPERRMRWVAELGAKIGITHAKALVEAKLETLEGRVFGVSEEGQAITHELASRSDVRWPASSGFGAGDDVELSPSGSGSGADPSNDG